jgi:hypothetical protein
MQGASVPNRLAGKKENTNLNTGIQLVPIEHPDTNDEAQVDPAGLNDVTYVGNSKMGGLIISVKTVGRREARRVVLFQL